MSSVVYIAKVEETTFYNVSCPECGEYIMAPNTGIGRYAWTEEELGELTTLYCPTPGCKVAQDKAVILLPFEYEHLCDLVVS